MATREGLLARFEALGIETRTVEHGPAFTVEDAQAFRGDIAGGHAKNLFVKDKKGALFLVVAEEQGEVDLKTLHKVVGASGRLSFCRPEQLMEHLGIMPGAVTPFAVINDTAQAVEVVLDEALMRHDPLNFHPLENTATTTIARADLVRFLEDTGHPPRILPITNGAGDEAPNGD